MGKNLQRTREDKCFVKYKSVFILYFPEDCRKLLRNIWILFTDIYYIWLFSYLLYDIVLDIWTIAICNTGDGINVTNAILQQCSRCFNSSILSLSNRTMSVKDDESILSLVFTADTRWLLSGHSVTGDIRVWDAQYLNKKPVACCMAAHELGTHYLQVKPCKY